MTGRTHGRVDMRSKTLFVGIFLLSASAVSAIAGRMVIDWYVNVRFAYSIAYPRETFIPQGEAANAGGKKFISRDGKALASVYGYDAPGNHTLTTVYNETLSSLKKEDPGWKVTYKSFKNDTFVIKGANDVNRFLKKVVYKPTQRQFVSFEAIYPASKSAYYEPMISTMSNSLKMLEARASQGNPA